MQVAGTALKRCAILSEQAIALTQKLVRYKSITPDDAGSFCFLVRKLQSLGFDCHEVTRQGVRNLVAKRVFGPGETLAFAGHLDVVPPGPMELWQSPPFAANIQDGRLYGRGVADMKGAIACFIAAVESILAQCTRGSLMFLITCDEEGEAEHGTVALMSYLKQQGVDHLPDYCLVGEPSSRKTLGDVLKIGRRGSLSAHIRVYGRQGHVAYPHNCDNATHHTARLLQRLLALEWDKGTAQMPGTTFQVTQLNSGEFVDNVVPGACDVCFNFRYSSRFNEAELKRMIDDILLDLDLNYDIEWQRPCAPYFNQADEFVALICNAIEAVVDQVPVLTTDGGTSDGRFIASSHTQVIEFGLRNDNIHQVNESADVQDISDLAHIYQLVIQAFCLDPQRLMDAQVEQLEALT
ncbi:MULTISPECIES: succinyl-diaminopimelate desuccinylase [Pseudoalteromonas]|uniref:succinyl-diaminopimelate desuccinylase n=1 Tax=Pseudoalteromonas TaxID=53246 RepID=UPI000F79C246|nr:MULTISPECIES: succinyl-diaminopimelate desuccinylase [Pseudoalteromonas]MCG7562702.1 succinyl-diaminopimelate desuccinylase [Pseudoalteromonas sp. McH1-42]